MTCESEEEKKRMTALKLEWEWRMYVPEKCEKEVPIHDAYPL